MAEPIREEMGMVQVIKKMKKISLILILLFLFSMSTFARQEKDEEPSLLEQPLLITSAGQSADVHLASVLAKKAELTSTLSKLATPEDLENIKTLVLVIGASLKGLGAAGLDVAKEKKRVNLLIEEAQKKNIPLLCLHLGGEARRGQLSDEFISTFFPYAKMAIVVKSGNKDGIFTRICNEKNIPLIEVEKTIDALEPFKQAFKSISHDGLDCLDDIE